MKVGRTYTFSAAHRLPLLPPEHKCHHLHGHNYRVEVVLSGKVDHRGFVLDFAELDGVVGPLLAEVEHKTLNDISGLENPTAEVVAQWFRRRIATYLGVDTTVRVWENDRSWAET